MNQPLNFLFLLYAAVTAHAAVVPHPAVCSATNANQSWAVDVSAGTIRVLGPSSSCLRPVEQSNTTTAALLPCRSGQIADWKIEARSTQLSFESVAFQGQCLGLVSHIWPVPVGRNYLIQLVPCKSSDHSQQWSYDKESKLLKLADGTCLDSSTGVQPPAATPCCENTTTKALPFCDSTLSHDVRAADLVSRLTVNEVAGVLSMGLALRSTKSWSLSHTPARSRSARTLCASSRLTA